MSDKTKFAINLKLAREKRGLTQEQVADALNISIGTISGYERAYRKPDPEMICKLADLYSVSTDWLLGREETKPPRIELPGLDNDPNPDFDRYAKHIQRIIDLAIADGDISPEEADPLKKETEEYLKFRIEQKRKEN